MKRILHISYFYSYKNAIGLIQHAFIKKLGKEKFAHVIYTSEYNQYEDIFQNVTLCATKENKYVKYLAAIMRRIGLVDLTWLPDHIYWQWAINVLPKIKEHIKKNTFDYVHSVSFPGSNHIIAMKVKKMTGLPWIAQFYDPWYENPYRRFKTQYFKAKDLGLERKIAENADLIIHNSQTMVDSWAKRYDNNVMKKVKILPMPFTNNIKDVFIGKYNPNTPLTISHIGNFMLNRTSECFIEAVYKLVNVNPELRGRLNINYIGNVTNNEKQLITQYKLDDIFFLMGILTTEECKKYYEESDLFIAIDGDNDENIFFPSKILNYFLYQKPILGITPLCSVLDMELKKSNNSSYRNDDIDGIADFLKIAILDYDKINVNDKDYWQLFLPEKIANQYILLVEELLNSKHKS